MNKIYFLRTELTKWGDKQAEISKLLCDYLASGKDFYVKFDANKTRKQHNGYWRLISLVYPFLSEDYGEIKSIDDTHEFIKIQAGFFKVIKTKHKEVVIPKSLKEATKIDAMNLIDKLYFICNFYEIKDYELKSQEKIEFEEFFKN
jgi:hypothetical protein